MRQAVKRGIEIIKTVLPEAVHQCLTQERSKLYARGLIDFTMIFSAPVFLWIHAEIVFVVVYLSSNFVYKQIFNEAKREGNFRKWGELPQVII